MRVLGKEWQLGFMPVRFFQNRIGWAEGAPEGEHYQRTLADAAVMGREFGGDTPPFTTPDTKTEKLVKMGDPTRTTFRDVMGMPNIWGIPNSAGCAREFSG